MKSLYSKFIFWLQINSKRFLSGLLALSIIFLFSWFKDALTWLPNHINYLAKDKNVISATITSILQNAAFALITYTFFQNTIDRWLGHDISESSQLNIKKYLENISNSTENVIIHETYIRLLITDYKEEFKVSLKHFFENCHNKHPEDLHGRVKILILHPFGDSIRDRYNELSGHLNKQLTDFLADARNLLVELKDVQNEINQYTFKIAKTNDFIQLKLAYEKPFFSFYYCDRYASISYYSGIPCEESPQVVFFNRRPSPFALKHKIVFDRYWERGTTLTQRYFDLAFYEGVNQETFTNVIRYFENITKSVSIQEIVATLILISDICNDDPIYALELLNYIERNHRKKRINYIDVNSKEHYSILGTGGDDPAHRTINISTIISILASHYKSSENDIDDLTIIKVGTLAVTGKIGSQTFYEALQSKISQNDQEYKSIPENKRVYLDYNKRNNSGFLPVIYFGYMYRDILREARRVFIKSNRECIDIYKVIFPLANFTGYKASINGVSQPKYLPIFEQIYQIKQKTGIIVKNQFDIDELCIGRNDIIYYKNGQRIHSIQLVINVNNTQSYKDFFEEYKINDQGIEHVRRFFKLFKSQDGQVTDDIKKTICYNVALFIQLSFLVNRDYSLSNRKKIENDFNNPRLDAIMKDVKRFYFDN